MTDSVGTLLKSSFGVMKTKLVAILVGSVVLASLMYGSQMVFQQQAINAVTGNPIMNMQHMQDLAERAQQGDAAAMEELMKQAEMMEDALPTDDEEAMATMGKEMFLSMLPSFGFFFVASLILSLLASAYYLLLAVDPNTSLQGALSGTPRLILPLLGVWIWSFLRSFAWIPIIGIIPAIIIGPRLMMSCVILVKEKKGVVESVRLSYDRSRGYWGKIVGNTFVAGLCMWLLAIAWAAAIAMMSKDVAVPLSLVFGYLVTAFGTIFVVKLSETVMANPMNASK